MIGRTLDLITKPYTLFGCLIPTAQNVSFHFKFNLYFLFFRKHYIEYLGILLNRYGLDPVVVYPLPKIQVLYNRHNIMFPAKNKGEDDEAFRLRLCEVHIIFFFFLLKLNEDFL